MDEESNDIKICPWSLRKRVLFPLLLLNLNERVDKIEIRPTVKDFMLCWLRISLNCCFGYAYCLLPIGVSIFILLWLAICRSGLGHFPASLLLKFLAS